MALSVVRGGQKLSRVRRKVRGVNDWERYAVARERLRNLRLDDGYLEDFGLMSREQAVPLMEEVAAGGRNAVQRLNAARGWIERA